MGTYEWLQELLRKSYKFEESDSYGESYKPPGGKPEMREVWMDRCVGEWKSYRRYLYGGEKKVVDNLITEFRSSALNDGWLIEWESDRGKGSMELTVEGEWLHRSRGYYTEEPTSSRMEVIDNDTIVFWSSYGGMDYREEIRFLDGDSHRLRQTVGMRDGVVAIVGQYFEERVS